MQIEWVEDEAVVLNPETHELHYLNPPAALAYALIQEIGYDEAVEELRKRAGDSADFEADFGSMVNDMREKGLLVQ